MKIIDYLKILTVVLVLCFADKYCFGFATDKETRIAAEELFEDGNYILALPYYLELLEKDEDNLDYLFRAGICYLYKSDEKEKSIDYLLKVYEKKPKTKDILYFLGKAYSLNYKFDEAAEAFADAKSSKKTSSDYKESIPRLIENCKNGKKLMASPVTVEIENIGGTINTKWSEYTPLISSDESIMIFTYRGEKSIGGRQDRYGDSNKNGSYFEDIYISSKENDTWTPPVSIGKNINTRAHEACISFSFDGQKLYVYKDTKDRPGDIYYSNLLDNEGWSELIPLPDQVNSKYSETSVSVSADGETLYFSSNRPKGMGGKDLYYCKKEKSGDWGEPINMGSVINTPYDDDAVFIHPDGKTLYFSSKGHDSMGGYDIFVSSKKGNGEWTAPKNMGYPINTAEDDIYFVVSGNGKNGYYSSGKSGGYGQQDIYVARLDRASSDHMYTMIRGQISGNDIITNAKIKVKNTNSGIDIGEFRTNPITGSYVINLPEGNYELTYLADGFPEHKEQIKADGKKFVEKELNIALISEGYIPKIKMVGEVSLGTQEENSKEVSISLVSIDSTINRVMKVDSLNQFMAETLPVNMEYRLRVLGIDNGRTYKVAGEVTSMQFNKPYVGIHVNDVYTDSLGYFEFERMQKEPKQDLVAQNKPTQNLPKSVVNVIEEKKTTIKKKVNETPNHKRNPYDEDWYNKLITSIGDKEFQGVQYKIQVGAYYIPRNFNSIAIKRLGEIKTLELNDGITRFTMGQFKKLTEANAYREKIMKAGIQDAFVTIFINGERKLLSEITLEKLQAVNTQ